MKTADLPKQHKTPTHKAYYTDRQTASHQTLSILILEVISAVEQSLTSKTNKYVKFVQLRDFLMTYQNHGLGVFLLVLVHSVETHTSLLHRRSSRLFKVLSIALY